LNIFGGLSGQISEGEERILRVKRIKVCYIYAYEDSIMKPTKHCMKKGVWRRGMEI
jgi:hypothetical protein